MILFLKCLEGKKYFVTSVFVGESKKAFEKVTNFKMHANVQNRYEFLRVFLIFLYFLQNCFRLFVLISLFCLTYLFIPFPG